MMVQISSQGIFNRFSIDRLYLSDEFSPPLHKNKNNDEDDNNNNISVRFEICAKGNEGYWVLIFCTLFQNWVTVQGVNLKSQRVKQTPLQPLQHPQNITYNNLLSQ